MRDHIIKKYRQHLGVELEFLIKQKDGYYISVENLLKKIKDYSPDVVYINSPQFYFLFQDMFKLIEKLEEYPSIIWMLGYESIKSKYYPSRINTFKDIFKYPYIEINHRIQLYKIKKLIKNRQTKKVWWICFKPTNHSKFIVFNTSVDKGVSELDSVDHLEQRWEIHLDERLLFLILSGYYHWANAEGGSHLSSKRVPNIFLHEIQDFLYFLVP